jgi:class 3 adenylate cyclase
MHFSSVTEALNCAIELQTELQSEPTVPLRIGLHVGEVFFENEKALGDGVNVASRIQSLGQANTILYLQGDI